MKRLLENKNKTMIKSPNGTISDRHTGTVLTAVSGIFPIEGSEKEVINAEQKGITMKLLNETVIKRCRRT